MGVAVFDYSSWTAAFPEMATVPESVAAMFWQTAGSFLLDNGDCSPVSDVSARATLLNYAVAHLAAVSGYPMPCGAGKLEPAQVGRVSSATEGSVSVSLDVGPMRENAAWWMQTQYGATFWQLTRALRTAHYRPVAPRYFGPAYGLGRGFGGS